MPMSTDFENRLYPQLDKIAAHFGTPFHIYDEIGIRKTGHKLKEAFAEFTGFREFFAVKALPNPRILDIMLSMGFGFDCSSNAELVLSRRIGARPEDIMFTSNNTSKVEFATAAADGGCVLNLDDISLIPKVPRKVLQGRPRGIRAKVMPKASTTAHWQSPLGQFVDAMIPPGLGDVLGDPRWLTSVIPSGNGVFNAQRSGLSQCPKRCHPSPGDATLVQGPSRPNTHPKGGRWILSPSLKFGQFWTGVLDAAIF